MIFAPLTAPASKDLACNSGNSTVTTALLKKKQKNDGGKPKPSPLSSRNVLWRGGHLIPEQVFGFCLPKRQVQ